MLVQPPARRPDVSLYRLGTEPVFFDRASAMDPQARKTKCRLNTLLTPNPSCERQGRGRRPTPPSSRRQPADPCNKVMSIEARNRSLPDWFTRIRTHQTVLPRFQRFEAWDHGRVTQLFNTLLQDLPVGSLLVLEIGGEEPFISRPLKGVPTTG